MSNITNSQILDQLWEEFQERGGDLAKFCNKVDLSNKYLTETEVIDKLRAEILKLKS